MFLILKLCGLQTSCFVIPAFPKFRGVAASWDCPLESPPSGAGAVDWGVQILYQFRGILPHDAKRVNADLHFPLLCGYSGGYRFMTIISNKVIVAFPRYFMVSWLYLCFHWTVTSLCIHIGLVNWLLTKSHPHSIYVRFLTQVCLILTNPLPHSPPWKVPNVLKSSPLVPCLPNLRVLPLG